MKRSGFFGNLSAAGAILAGGVFVSAQQPGGARLPSEPRKQFGASITGAFEGWYYNPDGSRMFLVGYLNRNLQQELDVPIGPNNRIEPGGPDLGQPTHFLAGRNYGMFTVAVPKDFTPQSKFTWTITANGQTNQIPLRLNGDYVVQPFTDVAVKNTPPVLRFDPNGPTIQGPTANVAGARELTASAAAPLVLPLWASDDAKYTSGNNAPLRNPPPAVSLIWSKYRGPGTVTFDKNKPEFEKLQGEAAFSGKATTTVRFSEAGDYMLHVTANDFSGPGGGGEVCCWSTAIVKVSVKP